MAAKGQRRSWRIARRAFRWCRIAAWLTILALLVLVIWFNRVGLPGFVKDRLVFALRERGMDLQFTRMRLVFYRGIVAENIQFGRSGDRGLRASATEADLQLRIKPLLRRQFDVKGVTLRGGRVVVPIWGTNDVPRTLSISKVNGDLRFLPNDQWELSGLRAEAFGVSLTLNGTVTNASAVRRWKFGREKPKAKTPQAFWHNLVRSFEETSFEAPSEIIGVVSGDARDLGSFRANLNVSSPAIDSPMGRGKNLKLSAQVTPQPGKLIHAEVKLQAEDASTRWGDAASVQLEAQLTPSLTQWTPTNAHVDLQVKRAVTPWASGASFTIKADFRPNPADPASSLAEYSVRGQQIRTKWARLAQAELTASGVVSSSNAWPALAKTTLKFAGGEIDAGRAASGSIEATLTLPPSERLRFADTNVSLWTRLDQITGEVSAQLTGVRSPKVDLKTISLKSSWRSPLLAIPQLDAAIEDGTLHGSASLNSATRLLSAEVRSDFDPQKVSALLTTNTRRWLAQFTWEQPPKILANVNVTLPAWTNQAGWTNANWSEDVLPTLALAGNFQFSAGSFRGVPVSAAQSDFGYSNRTWRLPNFVLTRPEGVAYIAHVSDERTRLYQFVIDSGIDPRVLRPLLDRPMQSVVDEFTITSPPIIHAEIAGQWYEPSNTSLRATLAATNLGFRAQPALECRALITLTNQILTFTAPEVVRTEGTGRADSVVIDIPRKKLFINNGSGSIDPAAVTKCIGPDVAELMAPYHFVRAPQSRAHGMVDLEDGMRSDLHFTLAGGPFEWRALRFQQITGNVHWAGTTLSLSNVIGSMHGGLLEGSMFMDFNVKKGANFAFRTAVRDINLNSLVRDLGNPTNKLEGSLSGRLVITKANTEDVHSWFGYGDMNLQDGLIWEVPVFGLFSPLINAINPGAGNNKAKEATATFIVTNGVIFTDDLSIRASGMRLNYEGTVDFDTRINGTMEAELFRNMPGIGEVVSKVFWPVTKLFEYRVTGTFSKPKSEPLYIPKLFMMPFHPLRTIRELIEGDQSNLLPPRP